MHRLIARQTRFATGGPESAPLVVSDLLPESLGAAVAAVSAWLRAARVPAIIVGGVAASLLGRPRLTRDVDALVDLPEDDWALALTTAANFDIAPRIGDPLDFARRSRVLLLRHRASQINIDIILGALPFEREAVAAGETRSLGDIEIRLPRVEDLMVMKAIAHRPRDMIDLEALLEAHPNANLERVRGQVREFSVAATLPELLKDLDSLVATVRTRG